jgi:GH24 family phage-related lysozyme (muramidase)
VKEFEPAGKNNIHNLPKELLEHIKRFEDYGLATGQKKYSVVNEDQLKKGTMQVGYCITNNEIKEAISYGYLPKGSKLPRRMDKPEADAWFERITVPTYLAQVKATLNPKIRLTPVQTVGLLSFCHNLGRGNLRQLICKKGRLNDGNMKATLAMIPKYNKASGKIAKGLTIRRAWELSLVTPKPVSSQTLARK